MEAGRHRLHKRAWRLHSALFAVGLVLSQPLLAIENPSTSPAPATPGQISHMQRGFKKLSALQLDQAIADFTAPLVAVARKPLSDKTNRQQAARCLVLIGTAFQFDENELAACQSYSLAHDLDPENRWALSGLISLLGRPSVHAECDKVLRQVSDLVGKDPIITAAAAGRARQCYNFPEATVLYTRAADLAPENARIQYSLA